MFRSQNPDDFVLNEQNFFSKKIGRGSSPNFSSIFKKKEEVAIEDDDNCFFDSRVDLLPLFNKGGKSSGSICSSSFRRNGKPVSRRGTGSHRRAI